MFTKISRFICIILVILSFTEGIVTKQAHGLDEEKTKEDLKVNGICYVVKEGDTLSKIAQECKVPLNKLREVNEQQSDLIYPGEILVLADEEKDLSTFLPSTISPEDFRLLAKIIYAEARGESFLGQVAVGAVVLNRVKSGLFPDTIPEVIWQKNSCTYQFSPVGDGTINLEPDETAYQAALEAIRGNDPTNGAIFFYNPEIATDRWIRTLPVITRIGYHNFATSY
jgi:N-acetylmuramoyl-L-alanine amidase